MNATRPEPIDDPPVDDDPESPGPGLEPWKTIREAGRHFSVGRSTLYELMADGLLPWLPVGRQGRRVQLSAVEAALRARAAESNPAEKGN